MLFVYGKVADKKYRPFDMDSLNPVTNIIHATVYMEHQREELQELVDKMNKHYEGEVKFEIRQTN